MSIVLSPWGEKLNKEMPLQEYPRMQLQRSSYTCLNGVWDYQINTGEKPVAALWQRIIVPFAVGSSLSGCQVELRPKEVLWYRLRFQYEPAEKRTLLNFEAVDQCCSVYLNGIEVGRHAGGYAPFSMDISHCLRPFNELIVRCTDDSDQGDYSFGKQKLEHGGMWYTPTAGIWQTVWLEDIPDHAVRELKITPDFDERCVYLRMAGDFTQAVITVFENQKLVHRGITGEKEYTIPLPDFHPWSVSDPFLYDLYIETEDDAVKSYFGMRKISAKRDSKGFLRVALNNKPLFLSGLLDQGYSVDGQMTYPSEDAMIYELRSAKAMGFNMLRKHVKQECRRWYYHCDRYGLLVMQDMMNGGGPYDYYRTSVFPTLGVRRMDDRDYAKSGRGDARNRRIYCEELHALIDTLYNHPCVFAWVPFNEGWGQFDSSEVTDWLKGYDTTRLVCSASGWHDRGCGDFNSRHCYFHAFYAPKPDGRILFLSEFGGYSYLEHGHGKVDQLYGYKKFTDKAAWNEAMFAMYERDVLRNIPKGLAGCVLTQLSDVEDECNGLFTADRKVLKLDDRRMKKMNEKCIRSVK